MTSILSIYVRRLNAAFREVTLEAHPGGVSVNLGLFNQSEADDLAAHLREAADQLSPISVDPERS